jgi:hypothetical protein
MSETALAYGWIYSTCTADATLMAAATGGVWKDKADVGTVAPYVLIQQQVMADTMNINGVRLFSRGLFQIKAVGPNTIYTTLVTIADLLDGHFKNARSIALSSTAGILASYREQELSYPDEVNGVAWTHLGGLYTIDVQAN